MVNLTFCRLDSAYSINSDNSEAQHLFPFFISLSAGRSSLLEFRFDLLSLIRFGAFQMHLSFRSSAFGLHFQERSTFSLIWGKSVDFRRSWIMIPICWMLLVSWWIFSNNRRRLCRSRPMEHFKLFKVFLIDSADSVYFCAFALFWLEIRLITVWNRCFW